jgi:hypothetical protein
MFNPTAPRRDLAQQGPEHRLIMKKLSVLGIISGAALLAAAPFSLQWSQKTVTLSLDSADARIGRPLTPLSVAGVHRRVSGRSLRSRRRRCWLRHWRVLRRLWLSGLLRTVRTVLRNWLWVVLRRLQLSNLQLS